MCLGACRAAVVREEEEGAVCEFDVWGAASRWGEASRWGAVPRWGAVLRWGASLRRGAASRWGLVLRWGSGEGVRVESFRFWSPGGAWRRRSGREK